MIYCKKIIRIPIKGMDALGDTRTENREINYVNDPVGKLYRRLLPSAIGSLLTATVASLIDVVILSYFLGPSMLAVVELCMPVYMLVNTLAMLISSGAATLYAHFLGEGDRKEALCWFSASTIHMLICGSVLMLAGLLFTGPVVRLLGANDAIMEPTMEYARVLFFFMIPLIMYVQLVFFVRIDDDPNRVLAATSVCAFVNLVLDTSSAGIRQIIAAHKQMNGALTLRNVTPEVLSVLHMTGLDKKLHIEQ